MRRVEGKSDIYDLQVDLDVNTEIYPIEKEKVYYFSIAKNIHGDADAKGLYSSDNNVEDSLFDSFEYVMYGKIFECKQADKDKM